MKPGDLVRCSTCGREATAYTTGDPARWAEGVALLISWDGYRHQATASEPERCLFCDDQEKLGRVLYQRAPPTRRAAIADELALHGCRTDGFEWNTDQAVEDAFQRWIAAGRPRCALVAVHPEPAKLSSLEISKPAHPAGRPQLSLF